MNKRASSLFNTKQIETRRNAIMNAKVKALINDQINKEC